MITAIVAENQNTARLDWLLRHVSYLEHTDKNGVSAHKAKQGGFWPQDSTIDQPGTGFEEYEGLSFIDYIDAQLKAEQSCTSDTAATPSSCSQRLPSGSILTQNGGSLNLRGEVLLSVSELNDAIAKQGEPK